jgi:ATP-dependent exoDNAse (exonuclease V) beta subunit
VLDRPAKVEGGPEAAVAPGLHASRVGGHAVVWWDPRALELDRGHEAGLRQQKLLENDTAGKASEEGSRAHTAWLAHRAALLARGEAPSITLTTVTELARRVSEGATAAKDASPQGAVAFLEVPPAGARPHGKRFGTLVHAVLAEVPFAPSDAELAALATKQARLVGATDEEQRAAVLSVRAALTHPIMQRAAVSAARGECRREVPVVAMQDDGALVEGAVDLAFREDAAWIVVDYKTDASLDAATRARYEAQVRAYAAAIARATGEPAHPFLLHV